MLPDKYTIIRLTNTEYSQLKKLKPGDTFYHVNLQHRPIPSHDHNDRYSVAFRIIKNGTFINGVNIEPELDKSSSVLLELLDFKADIPVLKIDEFIKGKVVLLENQKGVFESLFDKYHNVLNLSKNDISKMRCFLKRLKIIRFL